MSFRKPRKEELRYSRGRESVQIYLARSCCACVHGNLWQIVGLRHVDRVQNFVVKMVHVCSRCCIPGMPFFPTYIERSIVASWGREA